MADELNSIASAQLATAWPNTGGLRDRAAKFSLDTKGPNDPWPIHGQSSYTLSSLVVGWFTNLTQPNRLISAVEYNASTLSLIFQNSGGGTRNFVAPNSSGSQNRVTMGVSHKKLLMRKRWQAGRNSFSKHQRCLEQSCGSRETAS